MSSRTLTHEEARSVYNRVGSFQDTQGFYEDVATQDLIRHADFPSATSVFELGCGTGRFARGLLMNHLGPTATYRAVDLSPTMIDLAKGKLFEFGSRVEVILSDGNPPTSQPSASFDRFVSNYVFDLLSDADIRAVVAEAHRMLRPGGLLCLTSLSGGKGLISRAVAHAWSFVHWIDPRLVAGCRPLDLVPFLGSESWGVSHHSAVAPYGLPSEVVIAERLPSTEG